MSALPVELVCTACAAPVRLAAPRTGAIPRCAACGGSLGLRTPAIFACAPCGVRSKPSTADPNTVRACPTCAAPLTVVAVAVAAPPPPTIGELPTLFAGPEAAPLTVGELPTLMDPGGPVVPSSAPPASSDLPGFAEWTPEGSQPSAPSGSGSSLAPGASFGRYRIERELARGGMGIVYIALDPRLKRRIALKVLIAGEAASGEAVLRFVREARAAGQLRHPNIVAVHDSGEIDGRHFFTMDLLDGEELGKVAEAGRTGRETLLQWMRTICLALHHAHQHGIIHRDLKPANIMIEGDRPVVMDFGLAKELDANTFRSLSGAVFGTPAYMSPEQAQGQTALIDRRTDVYSLGVILYELVCGQRPFGGDTLLDTITAVVNDEPRPPLTLRRDVDADLDTIIMRCLEKDPAARYATAKDLADDIGRLLAGDPIAARPVAAPVRLWRRLRKRPALLAGIGGALAAAILAAFLFAGPSLVARLRREVASGDPERQRAAAVLLAGELHEGRLAGSQREPALALLRSLADGTGPAADAAIAALVEAGDAAALPSLRRRAGDASVPPGTRRLAADGVARLAAGTAEAAAIAVELVAAAAAGDDPALANALIPAAMALDPEAAATALAQPLADHARPAAWRVEAVQALAVSRPSLHGSSMRLLLRLAGDPDAAVGDAAARGLDLVRTRAQVLPIYGLESTGANVVGGLGAMAQAVADRDRAFAEEMAAEEGGERTPVAAIAGRLGSADAETRLAAASDLGRVGDATALPHLYAALADRDSGVRRAAGRAIAALAATAPPDLARVAQGLEATDGGVRTDTAWTLGLLEAREALPALVRLAASAGERRELEAVIAALGRIGDPAALPALQAAWATAEAAADEALALVTVRALAGSKALGGAGIDGLITALAHRGRAVREAALAGLVEATGEKLGPDQARWRAWRQRAP